VRRCPVIPLLAKRGIAPEFAGKLPLRNPTAHPLSLLSFYFFFLGTLSDLGGKEF